MAQENQPAVSRFPVPELKDMPDDIRERMFYPLVSGREGGSGLGLTLAQSFVQQHQGMIECESRPGYTCFSIRMPLGGA